MVIWCWKFSREKLQQKKKCLKAGKVLEESEMPFCNVFLFLFIMVNDAKINRNFYCFAVMRCYDNVWLIKIEKNERKSC